MTHIPSFIFLFATRFTNFDKAHIHSFSTKIQRKIVLYYGLYVPTISNLINKPVSKEIMPKDPAERKLQSKNSKVLQSILLSKIIVEKLDYIVVFKKHRKTSIKSISQFTVNKIYNDKGEKCFCSEQFDKATPKKKKYDLVALQLMTNVLEENKFILDRFSTSHKKAREKSDSVVSQRVVSITKINEQKEVVVSIAVKQWESTVGMIVHEKLNKIFGVYEMIVLCQRKSDLANQILEECGPLTSTIVELTDL